MPSVEPFNIEPFTRDVMAEVCLRDTEDINITITNEVLETPCCTEIEAVDIPTTYLEGDIRRRARGDTYLFVSCTKSNKARMKRWGRWRTKRGVRRVGAPSPPLTALLYSLPHDKGEDRQEQRRVGQH